MTTGNENVESPQALKTWWSGFKKRTKRDQNQRESKVDEMAVYICRMLTSPAPVIEPPPGIFGVPLHDSIKYANVAISLTNEHGESFIYGYVPIVVAKCGVFLKEKGKSQGGNYFYFNL